MVLVCSTTTPVPLHTEQVLTPCPPTPSQLGQFSVTSIVISLLVPNAASSKVIFILYIKSSPFLALVLLFLLPKPPKPNDEKPPPNTSFNISSKLKSLKSNPPENPPAPPALLLNAE